MPALQRFGAVSRRMVACYEQGEKPIPRTAALATSGLEMAAGQAA